MVAQLRRMGGGGGGGGYGTISKQSLSGPIGVWWLIIDSKMSGIYAKPVSA